MHLHEELERIGENFRRHALAVIADAQHRRAVLLRHRDRDRAALGRELRGVVQEIRDHLREPCRIAVDQ